MKRVRYLKIMLCMWACIVGIGMLEAFFSPAGAQTQEIAQQNENAAETTDEATDAEVFDSDQAVPADLDQEPGIQRPMRNYLFIHDTSKNMRKRKRIAMMQDVIRRILNNASPDSRGGLIAFGHRFDEGGPDACQDVEAILPIDAIEINREDFDTQLNMLSDPPLGGGAPIGLALSQGIEAMRNLTEPKDVTLFAVDLQECKDNVVDVLKTACQIPNLHVTIVGVGLKRDLQVLQDAGIDRLECVDIVNVTTAEEGETLTDVLLTRLSVQFKNAEDQLLDPAPGGDLLMTLSLSGTQGKPIVVRKKVKNAETKGESIETVGLSPGSYLLNMSYGGHDIRAQREIVIGNREEIIEVIRLGKMLVDVTDFSGGAVAETLTSDMEITLFDADKPIRSVSGAAKAEFDLLPGDQYKIRVSYAVGGKRQTVESEEFIPIREGNHQTVTIALPVGSLTGRIVDMQGVPAGKVDLALSSEAGQEGQQPFSQTLEADEQGNFFFQDIPTGSYTLTLSAKGYKRQGPAFMLVGGKINTLGDVQLFQGIEAVITDSAGKAIEDATVTITEKATGKPAQVARFGNAYRNTSLIPDGEYTISVEHPDHQSASSTVTYQKKDLVADVSFTLPYYVTIVAKVVNTRGDALPDARLLSQNTHASVAPLPGEKFVYGDADGVIRGKLAVSSQGEETLSIVWNDVYNQTYRTETTITLPDAPQEVNLGTLVIPMNFLTMKVANILGEPLNVDSILLTHQQTGQSGIQMNAQADGGYESAPLLDGNYTVRIMKRGYQDVEQQIAVLGGETKGIAVTLQNYVTVQGTVVDAKHNRIADAVVIFHQAHGKITSPQPVITGKDGRFQATLLAESAGQETFAIAWKSSASGNEYQAAGSFQLSKEPIYKFSPLELGMYELPANFIRVEINDVSGRGLPGADVQFLSRAGVAAKSVELGNGIYESLDLYDGAYNITVNKAGYKENIIIPDISVGQDRRQADAGKVLLPHYATITGTILNGKDEGVANVELFFGGEQSEQLEQCRTDQTGGFSTVLLVNGTGRETWKASWQNEKFVTQGAFDLPEQPKGTTNIGEVRLPVNFVTIPVSDIRGESLKSVDVRIRLRQQGQESAESLNIEEIESGMYQAQHLPDGDYIFSFAKDGFEAGRTLEVSVNGGMHTITAPIRLGYYVTVTGVVVNGKMEPVSHAAIASKALASTLLLPQAVEQPEEAPADLPQVEALTPEASATPEQPEPALLYTDEQGNFTAQFLVTTPSKEQLELSWEGKFTTVFDLDFTKGPEQQHATFKLPINFVTVQVSDISKKPLSGATVTIENTLQKDVFTLQENAPGVYNSSGIPDGNYTISVVKEHYQTTTRLLDVQFGEQQSVACQLSHYILVKGHILDGKLEGVSSAVVAFAESKTSAQNKVISGTDGAFEARLLVRDIGREAGEISWQGKHGTFRKALWLDLPAEPQEVTLTAEQTRLPINYLSLEVKSVAATGIPGATVKLRHLASGDVIEARDNDNGNYEGEELFDGIYDIEISKDQYQSITLSNISLSGGEHKRDVMLPKFLHRITISGVVVNGKSQGVPNASVAIRDPKKLRDCVPFQTREDGSFTLEALVTDVGSETLDVTWNDIYTTSLPIKLPFVPEQVKLEVIQLPINFISVRVVDIYNQPIPGAVVSFSPKQSESAFVESLYTGQELDAGTYESPELPNQSYLIIVQKEGYNQRDYPEIAVKDGQTISNLAIELPHIVTLKGRVTDGKKRGVANAIINLDQKATLQSAAVIETDGNGNFATRVQVIGNGEDALNIAYRVRNEMNRSPFELFKKFIPLNQPGEQDFGELRLPINFIPMRVDDVIGRPLEHAEISIRPSTDQEQPQNGSAQTEIAYIGEGAYEGKYVKDGAYRITVTKDGYQTQQADISITGGEVAAEARFAMPHYVTLSGIVIDGKEDGVANALVEFGEKENSLLSTADAQDVALAAPVTTDIRGQFRVKMLVKKAGLQQAKAIWNNVYVKDFSFLLPDTPDSNLSLTEKVRLPINFVPFKITNISGQELAGVDIQVRQEKDESDANLLANPLGNGLYEARELLDGSYAVTVHKEGYQEMTGAFTVQEGQTLAEQRFALPHYVTIVGTVVNGKGEGVGGAALSLAGMNSKLLRPEERITTAADGSFRVDVLVSGASDQTLQEQLIVSWHDAASPGKTSFELTHEFVLPGLPQLLNVGMLRLPANFYDVKVNDIAGRGLSGVTVTFQDEQAREFVAKEVNSGLYEGQNLPNGTYTVTISKEGYQNAQREQIIMTSEADKRSDAPLVFRLPYYVKIQGTAVDGKGQQITSGLTLSLVGGHSSLLAESLQLDASGNFSADVLVNRRGTEQLNLSWKGEYGDYASSVPFMLPDTPETVDFQRVTLPINFIPVEVKNLSGNGITSATVTLSHVESGQQIVAKEIGSGLYEGQLLPNGGYEIRVAKDGYKPSELIRINVAGGLVSETKSFRLQHYVWITGVATNGNGKGVNDPMIELGQERSIEREKRSDLTGKFEMQLEVNDIGNEHIQVSWNNKYRLPVVFKLPEKPESYDLGEIRLPINFISFVVTDVSGSTLPDVLVKIESMPSGLTQRFKTDPNGFCKSDDLPNGQYQLTVSKPGYQEESRTVSIRDGNHLTLPFTLPHYITIKGTVKDILQQPVGNAHVIFEEFFDAEQQKLQTLTNPISGQFEQRLLIDNPRFLERQKGHFIVEKDALRELFTFKIPTLPNQLITYTTLLFPINYLHGKVVDKEVRTIPLNEAQITLTPVSELLYKDTGTPSTDEEAGVGQPLKIVTDSLGVFKIGNLPNGEYKIVIQKEGYATYEDFIRISGLLQEQEFALRKE